MFLEREEFHEMSAKAVVGPATKAKILIFGLAYCKLYIDQSEINFLSHIPNHSLTMIVNKRLKNTNVAYPPYPSHSYRIEAGDEITIEYEAAAKPETLAAAEGYPLEEMVNLNDVHGGEPDEQKIEIIDGLPTPPTKVILYNCSFYTARIHRGCFTFSQAGSTIPSSKPCHIGHVLGGLLERDPTKAPESVIKITGASLPGGEIELPGTQSGQDLFYEISFDNDCNSGEESKCKEQVVKNARTGTDFFFYYDVLRDKDDGWKKFDLVPLRPVVPLPGQSTTSGGTEEVAACNPTIVEPPLPYD